ncbi:MAG: hypothetical protein R2827_00950 [Bdellovibrionales bacterium]
MLALDIEFYRDVDSDYRNLDQVLQGKLTGLEQAYQSFVSSLNNGFDAQANFTLKTNVAAHLQKQIDANPQYAAQIQALPVSEGTLTFITKLSGDRTSFPVVRDAQIPGLTRNQSGQQTLTSDEFRASNEFVSNYMMGRALSGRLIVNTLGICASLENGSFNMNKLGSAITANFTYKYDVAVERKFEVYKSTKYLHEILHRQKKRGGLFSTRTLHSLTEKQEGEKYLQIKSESIDSGLQYSDAEIEKLSSELRKEMMDEFVQQYGVGFFTKGGQVALIAGDQTAAQVAAGELKNCKHKYCQYGAIALNVAQSLFGGSTQTSSFRKTLQDQNTIQLHDVRTVPRFDTVSFEVKE